MLKESADFIHYAYVFGTAFDSRQQAAYAAYYHADLTAGTRRFHQGFDHFFICQWVYLEEYLSRLALFCLAADHFKQLTTHTQRWHCKRSIAAILFSDSVLADILEKSWCCLSYLLIICDYWQICILSCCFFIVISCWYLCNVFLFRSAFLPCSFEDYS